ncbi:YppG family protein [Bacillus cytotoxicus]|uniref:YppG family protein n=1 Tax=unclassified Bacillus cereus group TaxID=2750818 RepID=UPI001F57071B|nr:MULTISPECIES: YppG family protein [unclassified Bacillus cereus group]EMA6341925.1 YppG family protein [Bacillus cytotoxicus]
MFQQSTYQGFHSNPQPNTYQHNGEPYLRYNMYPFTPYYGNQNYYQPFEVSFMNQHEQPYMNMPYYAPPQPQPSMFYPPKQPFQPYPKMNKQKQQPSQFSSLVSQFKTADGNYDVNKMMNTAGQMMNAVNQVTGIVKQVGGFFGK